MEELPTSKVGGLWSCGLLFFYLVIRLAALCCELLGLSSASLGLTGWVFGLALYSVFGFAVLLGSAFGVTSTAPQFASCSGENFTTNGEYETNLNKLMSYLYVQAPPTGFGLGSIGQKASNIKVYGLALCRGDVSTQNCSTCVAEAISYVRENCPNSLQAMVWYDNCGLKYSNEDFFGHIDGLKMVHTRINVSNSDVFDQKAKVLLTQLAKEASVTPKMYAAGELALEDQLKKVYGLAQCTRDLSHSNCKRCLDGLISEVPNGKQGGFVISSSCNIRYETYQFVNHV
ncbi:hypothetical protein Ddye_017926 [Dipteronia dyeriana]|uniref:Gnk2-homologous domain-containing protein n=1 Tax=Dipteronia dyeriana TaxID=168575 RepID=A0AAD9U9M2_9ROSI|nr:hypothetical protein Ddye_017926 [Dipteronia dyeriana]